MAGFERENVRNSWREREVVRKSECRGEDCPWFVLDVLGDARLRTCDERVGRTERDGDLHHGRARRLFPGDPQDRRLLRPRQE